MKKMISVLTMVLLTTLTPLNVMAAENETEIEISSEDLREVSAEEALELGFTEEQIRDSKVYEVAVPQTEYNGTLPSVMNSGDVGYEILTLSSSMTGAAHQLNGKQMKWGVRILSGDGQLSIGVHSYNSNWIYNGIRYTSNENGSSYQSGWLPIEYGQKYYFRYYFITNTGDMPTMRIKMLLAVV